MPPKPIGLDLFAGAGGLSLGFEQAGLDVAAAVEYDPIHAATHGYNFPRCATICRSVADINGDYIRSHSRIGKRDIDVVFGGAPCQGFSLIGKRAFDDPRNHLVYHFARVVSELKPKYFVFENVRGLTLGEHKKFLEEIIAEFQQYSHDKCLELLLDLNRWLADRKENAKVLEQTDELGQKITVDRDVDIGPVAR